MNTQQIEKLTKEARHTNDPARLRAIANILQSLGARNEASNARNKAHDEERKQAERAA